MTTRARPVLAFGAVLAIWATALAMWAATRSPAIAVAATVDVVGTAGLAMYLLGVRGGHLPRYALTLTIAAGALVAKLVLASSAIAIVVALELGTIAWLAVRVRLARRGWRAARLRGALMPEAIEAAMTATGLPARVAGGLATELAVVAYALAGWRSPKPRYFTVHRAAGWPLIAGVFVFLTLAETPAVHLILVVVGAPTAAWVMTAMSLYGVLWLVGDAHALRHGGVEVTCDTIELRIGVRWRGSIPRDAIVAIECVSTPPARGKTVVDASIFATNVVVLHLSRPCELHGLVGRRRMATTVALSIDDVEAFVAVVGPSLRSAA